MNNIKKHIKTAVNENRDLIVSFVKKIVRTPSLANDEGNVQRIIHEKLNNLNLNSKIIPIIFSELENHPAFNDDGFSPESRINVTAIWKGRSNSKSLILNGHVDVVHTGPENLWNDSPVSNTHLTLPTNREV